MNARERERFEEALDLLRGARSDNFPTERRGDGYGAPNVDQMWRLWKIGCALRGADADGRDAQRYRLLRTPALQGCAVDTQLIVATSMGDDTVEGAALDAQLDVILTSWQDRTDEGPKT